jgi:hypothetical protein
MAAQELADLSSRYRRWKHQQCEYGDELQTEERIFWDCKLYEDQSAIVMDILPENSKKEYPKSVTVPSRLEEKIFVWDVCYFINNIPKFILKKEKEIYVQNINSIFLELS